MKDIDWFSVYAAFVVLALWAGSTMEDMRKHELEMKQLEMKCTRIEVGHYKYEVGCNGHP